MANVLASLVVKIGTDVSALTRGLTATQKEIREFGSRTGAILNKQRDAVAALAGAAGFGLLAKSIFEVGAAVEETQSKFNTVFGESAASTQRFIDSFGTVAGLSKKQAQEVLATTGAIAQGMGFAQQESAQFAQAVVALSADLSSFNNIPIADTSRAIQAALTGERESLKRLGIVINETDVVQRALVMTGKASAAELTAQEKAAASLALITERAGVAVGDLARTQDSAANRARAVAAELQNIKDTIASALLPVLSFAVEGFSKFIKGIQIMGAEAAVLVARMNVWKEAAFGTAESTEAAWEQLRQMRIAAEAVKNEVVGLTFGLQNMTAELVGDATALVPAAQSYTVAMRNVAVQTTSATAMVVNMDLATRQLSATYRGATAEANQLAAAQQRLSGAIGLLGAFGISFPFLGQLSGILSAVNSFSGGFAQGGTIPAGKVGLVGERGPELVRGPAHVTPTGGGGEFAAALLARVGPPPAAMTPDSVAAHRWWRQFFAAQIDFARHDGVRFA